MKNTIETIVEHPIASTIVIGCILRGIASIVAAARGNSIQPVITIRRTHD